MESILLLTQYVIRAGLYANRTVAASAINEATIELEIARICHLDVKITTTLGQNEYERWTWEAWNKMSPVFFLSPPDHFGHYMEDPHYQIFMLTYLGQS